MVSHAPTYIGAESQRSPMLGFLSVYLYIRCRRTKKFDVVKRGEGRFVVSHASYPKRA